MKRIKNSLVEMMDFQIFVLYLRLRVVNSNVHRLIFGLLKKAPALLVGAFLIYNQYKLLTNSNKTNNYSYIYNSKEMEKLTLMEKALLQTTLRDEFDGQCIQERSKRIISISEKLDLNDDFIAELEMDYQFEFREKYV